MKTHHTDTDTITLAEHGYFYVGAGYVERDGRSLSQNGMYVEKYVPQESIHRTPVVMIHGASQSGTNYVGTPDGRRGWVHDFLRAGYSVYVVDQPERGRSGHSLNGRHLIEYDVNHLENYFTAPGETQLWPQAQKHTQWPGTGKMGDPIFDQFYASQVDFLSDRTLSEYLNQQAAAALLDKIGPAILLTHSQSGPMGWLIADARPSLVRAIVALEPNGPPFYDVQYTGGNPWYKYNLQALARPFGLTRAPLTFDPPLGENESLAFELHSQGADEELVAGYLQPQPARQLARLQGIPIMMVVAEASYHAPYDHVTSAFLRQSGVDNKLVQLAEHGIHGNGHMMMLEKNNHQVAELIIAWLQTQPMDSV